jgi:hypothetical protein
VSWSDVIAETERGMISFYAGLIWITLLTTFYLSHFPHPTDRVQAVSAP